MRVALEAREPRAGDGHGELSPTHVGRGRRGVDDDRRRADVLEQRADVHPVGELEERRCRARRRAWDDRERDHRAAPVEFALAGLTQDDQDEESVEEVVGGAHGRPWCARRRRLPSAQGLDRGLIFRVDPWVDWPIGIL
jgi:hypothetical protein